LTVNDNNSINFNDFFNDINNNESDQIEIEKINNSGKKIRGNKKECKALKEKLKLFEGRYKIMKKHKTSLKTEVYDLKEDLTTLKQSTTLNSFNSTFNETNYTDIINIEDKIIQNKENNKLLHNYIQELENQISE